MDMQNPPITITVSNQTLGLALQALSELPFKVSAPAISEFQSAIAQALAPQPPITPPADQASRLPEAAE